MVRGPLYQHKFSITIIDDHDCILQGAASYLGKAFPNANISTFTEGTKFLDQLKTCQIDICIVDLELEDADGIELITSIKKSLPDAKIIVYTMHDGICTVKKLIGLSVDAIVVKRSHLDSLKKAVEEVYAGNNYYCERINPIKKNFSTGSENSFVSEKFNNTEHTIIKLTAQGYNSQGIADKTGHTKNTIMSYKRDIYRKFGVNSAAELIVKALEYGFITKRDLIR